MHANLKSKSNKTYKLIKKFPSPYFSCCGRRPRAPANKLLEERKNFYNFRYR